MGRKINVATVFDEQPIGRYQWCVIGICAVIAVLDGFDTQAIAYVAPVIAEEWKVASSVFGPVFAAGLLGLTLGAMVLGPTADRIGRKPAIIISCVIFGVFALMTVAANSVSELVVYRFLTGIGLGGCMPNIISLTSEFSPVRIRSTMITVMFCGFPLGAALGGVVSAWIIPVWGWESVFYLGGVLPLLLAPLLWFMLPESIRFLVATKNDRPATVAVLRKVFPRQAFAQDDDYLLVEKQAAGMPIRHIFTENRAFGTMLLWVIFFTNLLVMYFLVNWLPTLLRSSGLPLEQAIIGTVLLNGVGIVGGLVVSRCIDIFRSYRILIGVYAGAGIFTAIAGMSGSHLALQLGAIALAGFCVVGGQLGANALAVSFYPTFIRSSGLGWALGIGRLGSVLGPLLGGIVLARHWQVESIFIAAAMPAFLAALAMVLMDRRYAAHGQSRAQVLENTNLQAGK